MSVLKKVWRFFTSFGLVVTVLCFLFVVVFLGTLEQAELGLYAAVTKYFHSWWILDWFKMGQFSFPIALPGGLLLMILLSFNLLCGALIKARKSWRRPGMVIAHFSVLLLLVSGLVSYLFKTDGYLDLVEGQSSDEVESYVTWAVEIEEKTQEDDAAKNRSAITIKQGQFADLRGSQSRQFQGGKLPFILRLSGYSENALPAVAASKEPDVKGKREFLLKERTREKEQALNIPGVNFEVVDKESGKLAEKGILWGAAPHPYSFQFTEKQYTLRLGKKNWRLPFALELEKFIHRYHPGTEIPSEFSSEVSVLDAEQGNRRLRITMNEPLRHRGYTLYQESWGKVGEEENLYSQFAVSHNPADQMPLYSCVLATLGLGIHFAQMLFSHISRSQKKHRSERSGA